MKNHLRAVVLCALAAIVLSAMIAPVSAGQFIGNKLVVSTTSCWFPDAAYNSVDQKYLAVWSDYSYSPTQIRGQFITNGGALSGGQFVITSSSQTALYPAIAYNSINNQFLITWINGANDIVYGRIIRGSDGAWITGEFQISSGVVSVDQVAWNAGTNTYLSVFYAGAGSVDVRAVRISSAGSLLSGEINISNDSNYSAYPDVNGGYGSEFLVTWDDEDAGGNTNIRARRIDASTGALLGSLINVTSGTGKTRPKIAYDSVNSRYMICFNDYVSGQSYNQGGQIVSAAGSLVGGYIGLANTTAFEGDPAEGGDIAFVPGYQKYLSSFTWNIDMGGQEVDAAGTKIGGQLNFSNNVSPAEVYRVANTADTTLNRFLAVWQNWSGSMSHLHARVYEATSGVAPPGPVTNFVATAGNGQNVLTWTNPGEASFTGTMIRFKTNGYPTSTTDGTQIYNSNGTTYTHSGLTNGVTYYYTAWAHDAVPNYASGVNASATQGVKIIPLPQELTWKTGTGFSINSSTQIMANSSPDAREQNMAQQLQKKIWNTTGYWLPIVYGGSATSNVIAAGTPARCPAVNSIIATWSEASGKASKSEGYMLGVKDTSIVIRGYDDPGTFYGSQTLVQLLEYYKTTAISPLFTYDYPELPWRGVYMRVKWEHDWAFTKELISEMIARYKVNYISPEIHMSSVSHPEIPAPNENPVTVASAQDFLNFCRLHYITDIVTWYPGPPQGDPVPEECIFDPVRLARLDDLANDVKTYLNPQYVHCHESELSVLGCAAERAVYTNEYLYNSMLWQDWDRNYTARGMTPLIWQDMLDPNRNGGYPMYTAGAVATMPSGMIIADWEYGTPGAVPTDYPSLDRWISYNRKALGVPFGLGSYPAYNQYYGDKENIYYWANAVYNRRGSYPNNMLGLLAWNKYMANNREVVVGTSVDQIWQQRLLGCYPYYAEWAWNPNGRYWNPYPHGDGWSVVARQLAPARVSGFTATPSGSNAVLNWTNPSDSTFTGAYIVYKTNGYPTSPVDGTYLADVAGSPGAAGGYTHVGAPATAFYSVFSHDNVRHYSPEATAKNGGYCFEEYFTYSNGALNGNGGWTGSATSSQIAINGQFVQIFGGAGMGDAVKTMSCSADGTGYITVTVKVNGEVGSDTTLWNLWIDDPSANNLARWYGGGMSARGRIGTTATVTATQTLSGAWQELKVKIHPANNTTEFLFNDVSLGVYSHSATGAGDTIGRIRFERIDNSNTAGHNLYFDELTIGMPPPPGDTTPPGPVTSFVATRGDMQNSLSWTNPGDADFAGTMIRFSTAGYPGSPTGGTQCYNGTGTSFNHAGLTNGVTYYYTAFAYDEVPNYSSSVTASAVPADTTAPGPVTGFSATAGSAQNVLNWTNPGGDFSGTKIMFKTTGYPTGPTDGTQVYSGAGTTTTHSGLTNGVTYYYSAYAYDEVPNYSSAAQTSGTPAGSEFCFQDQFNYGDGVLNGNGGWAGNATASHIEVIDSKVRINGGATEYYATKTINCTSSPSGLIWVRLLAYPGTGNKTMWDVWINDASGKNFARWYGTGTTARGRIGATSTVTVQKNLTGGGIWDSLVVKIDPAANTSQFFYNGEDLGSYSHSSQGTGDVVGQIKLDRSNASNAAGHSMYIDNIRVSPY